MHKGSRLGVNYSPLVYVEGHLAGASWSEGKEKGGAKIISDNGFSCTIKGMWDNTGDSNFSLALYCYGTIQSKNEEYECYWNVIVKSRGSMIDESSLRYWKQRASRPITAMWTG